METRTFTVYREAVCSADDQLGPLELTCMLPVDATLEQLVDAVRGAGFLQFSSTHRTITGRVGDAAVVCVHATCFSTRATYRIAPRTPLAVCMPSGTLTFAWSQAD